MATSEKLGLKEIAVLNAIIALRLNSENDILEYDRKAVQEQLNRTNDSKNLLITLDVQRKIVMDLSERGILITDQITDNRFDNMFHLHIDPYCTNFSNSRPSYSWAHQTSWARKEFQEKEGLSAEEAYAKYGGKLFIRMTTRDIAAIDYNYMPSHKVRIAFDKRNPHHLCMQIDNERWKCISRLDPNQPPYKILKYAVAHPGASITRKDLSDNNIVKESRSLRTQVFSDNEKVKTLIPLLLEIDSDSILYKGSAFVTLRELDELKTNLKII